MRVRISRAPPAKARRPWRQRVLSMIATSPRCHAMSVVSDSATSATRCSRSAGTGLPSACVARGPVRFERGQQQIVRERLPSADPSGDQAGRVIVHVQRLVVIEPVARARLLAVNGDRRAEQRRRQRGIVGVIQPAPARLVERRMPRQRHRVERAHVLGRQAIDDRRAITHRRLAARNRRRHAAEEQQLRPARQIRTLGVQTDRVLAGGDALGRVGGDCSHAAPDPDARGSIPRTARSRPRTPPPKTPRPSSSTAPCSRSGVHNTLGSASRSLKASTGSTVFSWFS